MSGPEAGLEQKAEAWVEIVTVLQELGLGSSPNISGIDAAITFVRSLAEERDAAQAEIAGIRENCYYECVSKKAAREDINRVAKDFSEVADHWRTEAGKLADERDKLRAENAGLRKLAQAMYEAGDELFGHIEGGFLLYIGGRACDELAEFRDALVNWSLAQPPKSEPSATKEAS